MNEKSTCNQTLRAQGLGYPRTCKKCGLGPCVGESARPQVTVKYDLSPAETESQLRAKLIEMGWTPPGQGDKQAEPVAQPYAHIYEFDSAVFGTYRSFSPSQWNWMKPTRTVAVYTHPAQPVQPAAVAVNEQFAVLIKKANDQAEHFEREWYLRGDELEALEQVNAQLLEALKELMYARTDKAEGMAEAAIAAAEAEKAKGGV